MTDLVSKVNAYGQKKIDEAEAKRLKDNDMELEYIGKILSLKTRIVKLMDVGNACIQNCIPLEGKAFGCRGREGYDTHQFITNGWSHLTGFVVDGPHGELCSLERMQRETKIVGVGIEGGGACYYNLAIIPTNGVGLSGMQVNVSGSEKLHVLKRFTEEFDEFEREFYAYVERIVGKEDK